MSDEGVKLNHKDADTPEELTQWIWHRFVAIPIAGMYELEYENLLDRVRRMDRSSFTKGLKEARQQMHDLKESR